MNRHVRVVASLLLAFSLMLMSVGAASGQVAAKAIDGITFAAVPGTLFVPVNELKDSLIQAEGGGDTGFVPAHHRRLFDGTEICPVREVQAVGGQVDWDEATKTATVSLKGNTVTVKESPKRVIIDKSSQALSAYQGSHLILSTHVSTGREGHGTPDGDFTAGPAKERMHRSKLYHFAAMPYSVQVAGNIFIHGYTSVPNMPASHGCIRMPLTGGNPARYFYNWVDLGTPVTIKGSWDSDFAYRHARRRTRVVLRTRKHHHVVPVTKPVEAEGEVTTQVPISAPLLRHWIDR